MGAAPCRGWTVRRSIKDVFHIQGTRSKHVTAPQCTTLPCARSTISVSGENDKVCIVSAHDGASALLLFTPQGCLLGNVPEYPCFYCVLFTFTSYLPFDDNRRQNEQTQRRNTTTAFFCLTKNGNNIETRLYIETRQVSGKKSKCETQNESGNLTLKPSLPTTDHLTVICMVVPPIYSARSRPLFSIAQKHLICGNLFLYKSQQHMC